MASSRKDWTIGDYIEKLISLWEVDHIPEVMRELMVIKTEMLSRFTVEELEQNGVVLTH